MIVDIQKKSVRSSAILTTSYVAGTIVEPRQSHNQLIVLVDFTIGSLTSAELKIDYAYNIRTSVVYDNQTVNFTVGDEVIGRTSKAKGIIESDTDGGTTGTLVLTNVKGTFLDNEKIINSLSPTGGSAQINGTPTDTSDWYQETFKAVTTATDTLSLGIHQMGGTGKYEIETPFLAPRIRVSVKGTGTLTNSLMDVIVITGRV